MQTVLRFVTALAIGFALAFATVPGNAFAGKPPKNAGPSKKQADCYEKCNAPVMKCMTSCGKNTSCLTKCQGKMRDCSKECGDLPELPDEDPNDNGE